jgi:streptogramin lyase
MSDADVRARLRDYRDAALRHEVSPDAWPRLQRRLRREPWRRAGLAAAGVALVVAVAAVGPGLAARLTERGPATTARPGQPTVAARIPLGCALSNAGGGLGVGFGDVWVACQGALIRIDAATNRIAAVIPLQWMDGDASIAFSDDAVWVASGNSKHPVIYQLDPLTNRQVSEIPVEGGADGMVIAEGTLWVVQYGQGAGTPGRGTVARLDADIGGRSGRVELPGWPNGIRSGLGAVWVTVYDAHDKPAVYRVDPRTATPTRVARGQLVVAAGSDSLWTATDAAGANLRRVDPATGRVLATVPVPRITRVASAPGAVWACTDAKLYRLDPNSGQVVGTPVALEARPVALAVGEGSIWVGEGGRETAIVRLDPTP